MYKTPFLHIICFIFIFTMVSCTIPPTRDPVVKPSPPKPEVEPGKEKPIPLQPEQKTMADMPVTKKIDVHSDGTDVNVEGAINPITYQSNFASLLNQGKLNNFTRDDFKSTNSWNELIKNTEAKKSAFESGQKFQVVKVIELEGVNREAEKILKEYKSEIEILNIDERIFFLTFEESQKSVLDPARCFMGVKIDILDKISSDKFKMFPGVFAYDEGSTVIRASNKEYTTLRKNRG